MKIDRVLWYTGCFAVLAALSAFAQLPEKMNQVDLQSLRQDPSARVYPGIHVNPGDWAAWAARHDQTPRRKVSLNRSLPKGSFSILNYLTYVPGERDQWACGNCYVWAGTGLLEMELSYKYHIKDRLSTQFFNSCSGLECPCNGGWVTDIANFYNTMLFAIPWSNTNAQWLDQNGHCDAAVACDAIDKTKRYLIESCEASTLDTSAMSDAEIVASIKTLLNQGKAVAFAFYLPKGDDWHAFSQYWTQQNESTYIDLSLFKNQTFESTGAGHEVVCVGYTDNAWIMLNSWGAVPGLRPNGLFAVGPIDGMDYKAQFFDNGVSYDMFYWDMIDAEFFPQLPLSAMPVAGILLIAGIYVCLRYRPVTAPCRVDKRK